MPPHRPSTPTRPERPIVSSDISLVGERLTDPQGGGSEPASARSNRWHGCSRLACRELVDTPRVLGNRCPLVARQQAGQGSGRTVVLHSGPRQRKRIHEHAATLTHFPLARKTRESHTGRVAARTGPDSPNARLLSAALDPRHSFPQFRTMARHIIVTALRGTTLRAAAGLLKIHEKTLRRLRDRKTP